MFRSLTVAAIVLAPTAAAAQPAMPIDLPYPPNRHGLTFEANLGLGILRVSSGDSSQHEAALGGLDLGVGRFLDPKLAISVRLAGATYYGGGASIIERFLGPSAQYWITPKIWAAGGIGLGGAVVDIDREGPDFQLGLALDFRAGYTFNPMAKHSFNVSLEMTPAFTGDNTFVGVGVRLGYQYM